jgi:lipopolysaccharide biosynthesis protein
VIKTAAIVAHFDPNNHLEDNFRSMLRCLEQVFDTVILITTCDLPEQTIGQLTNIITIKRPNVGYDFYSYRVGLTYIYENMEVDNILLVNSSFIVMDADLFHQSLKSILANGQRYDAVAVTKSRQFNQHLQSYLLLLGPKVLQSTWFKTFLTEIQPLNSKLEIILSYEIGLSRLFLANDVNQLVLFSPSWRQRFWAKVEWMRILARTYGWMTLRPFRHVHEVNWTHFCAEAIAKQFGFAKTELLRTNPHGISTEFVSHLVTPELWAGIKALLDNSRAHYKIQKNGLTTLASDFPCLSACSVITYGNARTKGVRIAVVVHLYYFDLLDEICAYLSGIVEPYDLYVTTPFEGDIHRIINKASSIAHSVNIFYTENKGRDIGPFVALFHSGLLDNYFAVLKLHSKKSKYSSQGAEWRKQLLNNVVGDSLTIRRTLELFEDENIGLVGPHKFYLSHDSFWGANYENVKKLLLLSGSLDPSREPELGFFAGSMFWFTPNALMPLRNIPTHYFDFEAEYGKQDGTLAHAVERVFCSIVKTSGYKVTSVSLAGVDISEINTQLNRVPVL